MEVQKTIALCTAICVSSSCYICPCTTIHMYPHTDIDVGLCNIYVPVLLCVLVLIKAVHDRLPAAICVLVLLNAPLYCYICVLVLLYVASYYYICVLVLLYVCGGAWYSTRRRASTTICVLILLHIGVLILLCIRLPACGGERCHAEELSHYLLLLFLQR